MKFINTSCPCQCKYVCYIYNLNLQTIVDLYTNCVQGLVLVSENNGLIDIFKR